MTTTDVVGMIITWALSLVGAFLVGKISVDTYAHWVKGFEDAGRIWGPSLVRWWRVRYNEPMPRYLWPRGTPDDADDQAIAYIAKWRP
jgi:hypothetical protein